MKEDYALLSGGPHRNTRTATFMFTFSAFLTFSLHINLHFSYSRGGGARGQKQITHWLKPGLHISRKDRKHMLTNIFSGILTREILIPINEIYFLSYIFGRVVKCEVPGRYAMRVRQTDQILL